MALSWILLFLTAVLSQDVSSQDVPIEDRIHLLEFQIKQQIKQAVGAKKAYREGPQPHQKKIINEDYEYIDTSKMKLTPIMSYDKRKKDNKFRMRQLNTTPRTEEPGFDTTRSIRQKGLRQGKVKDRLEHPRDKFYRRAPQPIPLDSSKANMRWMHCQDTVTPFITGAKCNLTRPAKWTLQDKNVDRLLLLLRTDTTNYTNDEMKALLYQISNLPIKLYRWDITALHKLMTVISEFISTYWRLKHGLKTMFKNWNLDMGDPTQLLQDTKIIRPYCTQINMVPKSTFKTMPTMITTPESYATTDADFAFVG